jgi:hypothetical protein
VLKHKTILVSVFADNATKTRTAASSALIFPALTSAAAEIAGGSALAIPQPPL